MPLIRNLVFVVLAAALGVGTFAAGFGCRPLGAVSLNRAADLEPVTVGRTTVAWNKGTGLSLSVDGVPVVRKSSFYIVNEGFKGSLLDFGKETPVVTGWTDEASGAKTAEVSVENDNGAAKYRFTVAPGNTVVVDLSYRLKTDAPAEFEYTAGLLNGPALEGAKVRGGNDQSRFAPRTISPQPPAAGTTQEQNRLTPPFRSLALDTRLGQVRVDYTGTAENPIVFDARSESAAWYQEYPVFWMGLGSPVRKLTKADGEQRATFSFSIGGVERAPVAAKPAARPAPKKVAAAKGPVLSESTADRRPLVIIPRPKNMKSGGNAFRLTPSTRLVIADRAPAEDLHGAVILRSEIRRRFGINLKLVTAREAAKSGGSANAILIGGRVPNPLIAAMQKAKAVPATPAKPEGYAVAVTPKSVAIAGTDSRGALWGAQTVVQMLAAFDGVGAVVRPAVISDWPSLKIRAAHLFYGSRALPFHTKLIERVFSRYKLNAIFLQAEQVRWKHDPSVAPKWAGSPEDIRAEIALAKRHGITVYPLMQSYGHMEWMFGDGKNVAFAEDPEQPYAVNYTNPAAVKYIEGFNNEADRLFGAPGFHIGFDEVTMRGRFPHRSKPKTFSELYVDAAKHWRRRFKDKQLFMWADMSVHPREVSPSFGTAPSPEEAAKVRAGLPKDIVMIDWQYMARPRYPSIRKLKEAGFKNVMAATWNDPQGIQNFSKAAVEVGALGAVQTTWAGYESYEGQLDTKERYQFVNFVLAAEYFWNGGEGPNPKSLPYDPATVFADQWKESKGLETASVPGALYDLTPIANVPTEDWRGYGPQHGPAELATPSAGARFEDGVLYRVGSRATLLAGGQNPPDVSYPASVTLAGPPGTPDEIRLAVAASHRASAGTKVATVEVTHTDGTTDKLELAYGRNLAAMDDPNSVPGATLIWTGATRAGQPAFLRAATWKNRAAKPVASLTLTAAADAETALALFAVTAID